MVWTVSARRIATLSLIAATSLTAQPPGPTTLPPTSPTAVPIAVIPSVAANDSIAPEIEFLDGKLHVVANGASLNSILRAISRVTSIAIIGGVADQRVYGTYGPATPGDVLGSLLDGIGANMLLRETTASTPGELILTPRTGGPTPPTPAAASLDENPPAPVRPRPIYGRPPPYSLREAAVGAAPEQTPASYSDPATPNSELTPSQIYQQLQQVQRAKPPL